MTNLDTDKIRAAAKKEHMEIILRSTLFMALDEIDRLRDEIQLITAPREEHKRGGFGIPARVPEKKTTWQYDEWDDAWECNACNYYYVVIEGTPKENDINYCPKCGRRIEKFISRR